MKISRQYCNSSTWSITAAMDHVLEDYGLSLDDCGFAYRDYGSSHVFTISIPKRVNLTRFLALLAEYVFVGPSSRDLF